MGNLPKKVFRTVGGGWAGVKGALIFFFLMGVMNVLGIRSVALFATGLLQRVLSLRVMLGSNAINIIADCLMINSAQGEAEGRIHEYRCDDESKLAPI